MISLIRQFQLRAISYSVFLNNVCQTCRTLFPGGQYMCLLVAHANLVGEPYEI